MPPWLSTKSEVRSRVCLRDTDSWCIIQVMSAAATSDAPARKATELLDETERLYVEYLLISTVSDLAQLGQTARTSDLSVFGGPAPVGLVVTGA